MRRARLLLVSTVAVLVGCQSVAPALTSLLMAFGQDLLATTAVNYTPRYAVEVENLLATLARHATGLQFQGQLAQAGYQPPPPDYMREQQAASSGQSSGYGQPVQYGQPAYQSGDGQNPYGGAGTQDPYSTAGAPQDPYAAAGGAQDAGYGYGQATYTGDYAPAAESAYQDPYAIPAGGYRTRSAASDPVSLGVALLARRAGTQELVTVEEGDTLRDGRGDPSRGDLLRVHFQANCDCWVYVIGIDATGYVAQIFPDPDSATGNPVTAGVNYLMPGGDQWWGLDEQRGIEQIYFVAAREARPDIEEAVVRLSAQPRRLVTDDYRGVAEPAILPTTRGLVKVAAPAPVTVPMDGEPPAAATPAIFSNSDASTDLVITRWFRHE